VVCGEFFGPFRNGGIGTAYTRLAELLNEAGHQVTLLYSNGRYTLTQPVEYWIDHYLERGMQFVPLPEAPVPLKAISYHLEIAHRVYLWLKTHDEFDIVHFPEANGHGFYAVAAQRQGLILQNATTIVGLHGSSLWSRVASERLACWERELEDDFLERRSAELADIVWSPGQYMLGWVREQGWDLRNRTHVQPYVVPAAELPASGAWATRPVCEIVFFGRQEVRKGLFLFLDAVDHLAHSLKGLEQTNLVVTFLGKPTAIGGTESGRIIRERGERWPFLVRVLSDQDPDQALVYLRGQGRLAVMPSLVENYPNTVLECLAGQVPFLASRVGGIPEQIARADQERVCFEPKPRVLAQRLLQAMRQGHAPARLSFDPAQNNAAWVRWHAQIHDDQQSHRAARAVTMQPIAASHPTVSVCITHHGHVHHLRDALASILNQERPPLEVIVVAVANRAGEFAPELDDVERAFGSAGQGWRLLRQDNCSLGAARNRAAALARGDLLLFLSEASVAKPQAIATFTDVARQTGTAAVTCLIDVFHGSDPPGVHSAPDFRRLFSGANYPLSLLHNTFGDSSALFPRSTFLAALGFSDELEVGQDDWELFVRLMVRGYQIAVIPESLFCDRVVPSAAVQSRPTQANYLRALRSYVESMPRPYHTLLELTMGQSLAKRVVVAAVATDSSAVPARVPPLRYRMLDALNARLKRAWPVHRLARGSVHRVLQVRALLRNRRTGGSQAGEDGHAKEVTFT